MQRRVDSSSLWTIAFEQVNDMNEEAHRLVRWPAQLLAMLLMLSGTLTLQAEPFVLAHDGKPAAGVHVNVTGAGGNNAAILRDAGEWLAQNLGRGLSVAPTLIETLNDSAAVIIARADQYPDIAARARLNTDQLDAYCIVSTADRLYLLGVTEVAARHAAASLLHDLGYRFYNPMPTWWIAPSLQNVTLDRSDAHQPVMLQRSMWYAYGVHLDHLKEGYDRWRTANRLIQAAPFQTGHSYGNIILRNAAAFEAHPEYFALLENGQRDSTRAISARKFCVSNPELVALVVADRIALLREQQQANPYAFMVSIDPSDGGGTCVCKDCAALGTDTDRVIHLANAVAKGVRAADPRGWVGLYAYSSHRLPPTIAVEPNVYVQVAMGFNRTEFTLDELVSLWAQKVTAIGLREYYAVEEWDWGLPGRMRGADVTYHQRWIPFYVQRHVNAVNSQINANWGGQTLGLYVASQLMWNPKADVQAITNEYFRLCYGEAADIMKRLHARFDEAGELNAFTLSPMFTDVRDAFAVARDDSTRQRLTDMMAYLLYVAEYQRFETAQGLEPKRGDIYYTALERLMRFAWQTRHRGMIHSYALARRLCNGLPLTDGRFEFWLPLSPKNPPPKQFLDKHNVSAQSLPEQAVWIDETQLTDAQIQQRFDAECTRLVEEASALASYSDTLKAVTIPGDQAGHAQVFLQEAPGQLRVRGGMSARLLTSQAAEYVFRVSSDSRSCEFEVTDPAGNVLITRRITQAEGAQDITVTCSQPGAYRVTLTGSFLLTVPADATLAIEASPSRRLHGEYTGGHFFYVPRGTRKLHLNVSGRLSLMIPGKGRLDLSEADRDPKLGYIALDVPKGADGAVWQTFHQTRGTFYFINIPPYVMPHRAHMALPADLAAKEGLK